jgi:hypothetical protein
VAFNTSPYILSNRPAALGHIPRYLHQIYLHQPHSAIPELFCLSGLSVDELGRVSLPCRQLEVLWPSSTAVYSDFGASCR